MPEAVPPPYDEDEPPPCDLKRYFLLRSGTHYIVAQTLIAVKQEALPAAVRGAIGDEFERAADPGRIEAVELPDPGDPCDDEGGAWTMMAMLMGDMNGGKK